MQKNAQFIRNIPLTLHQLEHYSFHTSNKPYFLQNTAYTTPIKPHFYTNKGVAHGRVTNQLTYQRPQVEKSLVRFIPSCVLRIAGLSNTFNYNWDYTNANKFPVTLKTKTGCLAPEPTIEVGKSTNKITCQKCQHNWAEEGKHHLYQIRGILHVRMKNEIKYGCSLWLSNNIKIQDVNATIVRAVKLRCLLNLE